MQIRKFLQSRPDFAGCLSSLALMFAVKSEGAVERPFGETAVGEKGHSCAEPGAE